MSAIAIGLTRAARSVDGAALAILAIFGLLILLAPAQGRASLDFTAANLLEVAPFLLLSIGLAAYAKASGADNLIARAFTGRLELMVLFAALMGALSPFCSCGVIPLIAALLSMGVPLPPVMAFWLASPIMDPSMFVLTAGTLGTGFALFKTGAAIGIGLLGGCGMMLLMRAGWFETPLRAGFGDGGCAGGKVRTPKPIAWSFWHEPARRQAFWQSCRDNGLFLGKWLALAFVLESLMLAYVPAELVAGTIGGHGWLTVLGATLVGIPAYLNGYAALPLIAGLLEQGMAPGAAMAFLLAGGVTSIPAAIAVYALARLPVFFAYLAFACLGSLVAGLLFGLLAGA